MSKNEPKIENNNNINRMNAKKSTKKSLLDVVGILKPTSDQIQKEIDDKTFEQLREAAQEYVAQNYKKQ